MITVTSSPKLTSNDSIPYVGATEVIYTRTFLGSFLSRITLLSVMVLTPSFFAIANVSAKIESSRDQTLLGLTLLR